MKDPRSTTQHGVAPISEISAQVLKTPLIRLVAILAAIPVLTCGIALFALYRVGLNREGLLRQVNAQRHARLIAALYAVTHDQAKIKELYSAAHQDLIASSPTSELVFGKREGDQIVFCWVHRGSAVITVPPVPWVGPWGEPMRRPLRGETGHAVVLDRTGATVLAGYAPVPGLGWAVAAKVDLAEVRAPYFRAMGLAIVITVPLALLGAYLTYKTTSPLIQEVNRLNQDLERRVCERTAELEAANKEMEAFTYSVSHDLRAPLRHVSGFTQLLTEGHAAELSPEARRYLGLIQDGAHQMGQLIDDLLNLSRVGRQQLRAQVTGLRSLVEEAIAQLQRENPGRSIDWRIQPLPFVECDPALIRQVFVNLLSNAAKFTRPRDRAVIEIGATAVDGETAVFVRDNGVGFSMKYADKLFGVFQQLHRKEDFEGTGVGLATVQRIIHKHGGRVWAHGELDKGATFYFTLNGHENQEDSRDEMTKVEALT